MEALVLLLAVPVVLGTLNEPIDLTKHFDEQTVYWAGDKKFNYTEIIEDESLGIWIARRYFEAPEHGGTHMDAPFHFYKNGWRIGDIPFNRFFGKGVMVDLRQKANENKDLEVQPAAFEEWEKTNGKIPEGAIVLLNFNWTQKSDNKAEFFGSVDWSNNSTLHFPGLSEAAAKWLVERGVYGVGTDAASIDPGQSKEFKAHQILSEKNIFIIEQAALNVTALPATGYQVLALPMKLRYGTGAPCRLLAMP